MLYSGMQLTFIRGVGQHFTRVAEASGRLCDIMRDSNLCRTSLPNCAKAVFLQRIYLSAFVLLYRTYYNVVKIIFAHGDQPRAKKKKKL
jgi:hypothetical protein